MSYRRFFFSLIAGSVVVLAMLIVGLRFFYDRADGPVSTLEAFEVNLLTPEEAARLLGEDPFKRRMPDMPLSAPGPADSESATEPEQPES